VTPGAEQLLRLLLGVAVLLAVSLVVLRVAGVAVGPWGTAPLTAVLRGALQLAAVALVLRGVFDHVPALAAAVLFWLPQLLGSDPSATSR